MLLFVLWLLFPLCSYVVVVVVVVGLLCSGALSTKLSGLHRAFFRPSGAGAGSGGSLPAEANDALGSIASGLAQAHLEYLRSLASGTNQQQQQQFPAVILFIVQVSDSVV